MQGYHLTSGKTKSCGCYLIDKLTKHGKSKTRLYRIWELMIYRCYNEDSKSYKNYGLRGIQICDEWVNNFEDFYNWAISNGYQENLTIDRIDNNGNYEPDNCRWATYEEQNNKTRRSHIIEINNQKHTVAEWSDLTGINYTTIWERDKREIEGEELIR